MSEREPATTCLLCGDRDAYDGGDHNCPAVVGRRSDR